MHPPYPLPCVRLEPCLHSQERENSKRQEDQKSCIPGSSLKVSCFQLIPGTQPSKVGTGSMGASPTNCLNFPSQISLGSQLDHVYCLSLYLEMLPDYRDVGREAVERMGRRAQGQAGCSTRPLSPELQLTASMGPPLLISVGCLSVCWAAPVVSAACSSA